MYSSAPRLLNCNYLCLTKYYHSRTLNSVFAGTQFYNKTKNVHNRTFTIQPIAYNKNKHLITQDIIDGFVATFPSVIEEFTKDDTYTDDPNLKAHLAKMMTYNVPKGKNYRGLTAVSAYKMIEKKENLTNENIHFANAMGWIIEVHEGFIISADDIMDQSQMRRGVPCWYIVANKGNKSLNDSLILQKLTFALLKSWFSKHPAYLDFIHLFQDVERKVSLGQCAESMAKKGEMVDFSVFKMDIFKTITNLKTGSCVFYLPLVAAMLLANIRDQKLIDQIAQVTAKIALYTQIENDVEDCFDYIRSRGYMGNDIRQGKLTWLAVKTIEKATPAQRKLMENHYGRNDDKSEKIIKDLYQELDLESEFHKFKEESLVSTRNCILNLDTTFPKELLIAQMESVYLKNTY